MDWTEKEKVAREDTWFGMTVTKRPKEDLARHGQNEAESMQAKTTQLQGRVIKPVDILMRIVARKDEEQGIAERRRALPGSDIDARRWRHDLDPRPIERQDPSDTLAHD